MKSPMMKIQPSEGSDLIINGMMMMIVMMKVMIAMLMKIQPGGAKYAAEKERQADDCQNLGRVEHFIIIKIINSLYHDCNFTIIIIAMFNLSLLGGMAISQCKTRAHSFHFDWHSNLTKSFNSD